MYPKKRVFLFGAGSALEWNAPKTSELTEIVLQSGFKMCDNKTTITRFIYQTLLDKGYSPNEVNFETIISVIEELVVYYSDFNSTNHIPSIYRCFFESKFNDEILNYSIEGGTVKHGYLLEIPKGVKYNMSRISYQNETTEQFFFEHLLGNLLDSVCARIIEYSYYSANKSSIDLLSESSLSFVDWMKLHRIQSSLRLYTLNYDRVFKVLLKENSIDAFEGFDTAKLSSSMHILRPNISRILSDFQNDIHYNLHGSIHWNVEELDSHQLANAEIFFEAFPNLPGNNTPASLQIEKGKTLMVTNIITGFQKAQKAMITPFKQMQAAFDRDCCFAEEIYIIGYSFGDEHINASLRTALRHNDKLKIIIVDPLFMKNNFDVEVSMKLFSAKNMQLCFPVKLDENIHSHFNETFIVYTMGFKEFRSRQLNPFNKAAGGILNW